MATPVILANISQTLMGLVDTLMVGRLGAEALAAVGLATLLFSALAMSLKHADVAAQTITARRVGEGRDSEVGAVLTTALSVAFAVGTLLMLVGLLWPHALMSLVSQDPEVRHLGEHYLRFRYAGMLPLLAFFMIKAVFDGIGWTRTGMFVGIGMNLANVGLNWVFIYGKLGAPEMGVAGAALASTVSAALAAIVILAAILRPPVRRRFGILHGSHFQKRLIRPFVELGWPPAVQTLGNVLALLAFFFILGRISTVAVATGNVVLRIAALSFMPGVGVSIALQTLVGQSLGRRDKAGARRSIYVGVGLAVVVMGLFGLVFLFWPGGLMRLFSPSEELISAGKPILRVMGLVQIIDAVGLSLSGAMRGAGATRPVMMVDILTGFVMLPPLTWLFGITLGGGLLGAWWALLTWFTLYAVGMVVIFLRNDWEGIKV